MSRKTEKIKQFRLLILQQISSLSTEQLNFIPEGFTNNIIWNIAHLLSATQSICYKRAGLPLIIDDKYYADFLPGTGPCYYINNAEIALIKKLFIDTVDTIETDLENNRFSNYTRSEKIQEIYGVKIADIDDALDFILYYDGSHSGSIAALKHFV